MQDRLNGGMALPKQHLGAGERELATLRTHVKRIMWPLIGGLVLIVVAALAALFAPQLAPPAWGPWLAIGIWALAAILFIPMTVLPWLRWRSTTYTLTDRRIITRTGILTRKGHDLPLRSISNVSTERGVTDRMFGCGTLVLVTSAETPLRLDDIPDVERVNVLMSDLIAGAAHPGIAPQTPYDQAQGSS